MKMTGKPGVFGGLHVDHNLERGLVTIHRGATLVVELSAKEAANLGSHLLLNAGGLSAGNALLEVVREAQDKVEGSAH